MSTITRLTVRWDGFTGGPGFTNFYGAGASPTLAPVVSFFDSLKTLFPIGFRFTIPNFGDTLESTTGVLTGTWAASGGGSVVGTGVGPYAGPVGAVVNWQTGGINRGKKVRGRIFLVPLDAQKFDGQGTLVNGARDAIQGAADTLIAALTPDLLVWSRPRLGTGGAAFPITTAVVPDLAAVLRSRRD